MIERLRMEEEERRKIKSGGETDEL